MRFASIAFQPMIGLSALQQFILPDELCSVQMVHKAFSKIDRTLKMLELMEDRLINWSNTWDVGADGGQAQVPPVSWCDHFTSSLLCNPENAACSSCLSLFCITSPSGLWLSPPSDPGENLQNQFCGQWHVLAAGHSTNQHWRFWHPTYGSSCTFRLFGFSWWITQACP